MNIDIMPFIIQVGNSSIIIISAVISSIWLQGKDKTQSCKSNKKTSEKFNCYFNKQETKGSNNCVGKYKKVCEIEKKMFVVILIGMS